MTDHHICPECRGSGIVNIVWRGLPESAADVAECGMCCGDGYVPRAQAERHDRCKEMRRSRVAAGKSLHQAAREMGITTRELSDIEWGRTTPRDAD